MLLIKKVYDSFGAENELLLRTTIGISPKSIININIKRNTIQAPFISTGANNKV